VYLPVVPATPTTTDGAHKGTSVSATIDATVLFTSDAMLDGTDEAQIASVSVADLDFRF